MIGLSFLMITLVRSASTYGPASYGGEDNVPSNGWNMHPAVLLAPRELSLDIKANNTVNVYILDEAAAEQWNMDKTLRPTWAFENITQKTCTVQINDREAYSILTYLPTNATAIKVTATLYGVETDLLWVSVIFTIIGITVITISAVIKRGTKMRLAKTTASAN